MEGWITRVRALLAAATPGPWSVITPKLKCKIIGPDKRSVCSLIHSSGGQISRPREQLIKNAAFISTARTDLETATEMLTVMREALEEAKDEMLRSSSYVTRTSMATVKVVNALATCDRLAERG